MKVLNIIQCSNLGGMEQSTLESLTELKNKGHDVEMVSLHPAGGPWHSACRGTFIPVGGTRNGALVAGEDQDVQTG